MRKLLLLTLLLSGCAGSSIRDTGTPIEERYLSGHERFSIHYLETGAFPGGVVREFAVYRDWFYLYSKTKGSDSYSAIWLSECVGLAKEIEKLNQSAVDSTALVVGLKKVEKLGGPSMDGGFYKIKFWHSSAGASGFSAPEGYEAPWLHSTREVFNVASLCVKQQS